MKKTLLFALVLGLAVMFAVPAFAFKIESGKDTTFYIGGVFMTDLAAWNRSKELFNGKSDNTQLLFDVPKHSRIRGLLEVGNVGGYWELRLAADQRAAQGASGNVSASGGYGFVESAKLYGYYKFGNCTFLAGKTDGHIMSVVPGQNIGFSTSGGAHFGLFGWGNIYDNRDTQIRFSQEVSKTFGYDISLVQPHYFYDNGVSGATASTTAGAIQSYGTFPLAAAKLRMNFGAVSLMPAGWVQYVKWDNLPATPLNTTPDDNMTAWGLVLPVVVKAGAFVGTFQATYGQNQGNNASFINGTLSAANPYSAYRRTINGAIKSTTGWNAFMDLAFTSGAVTPHFYMGYDKAINSDAYGLTGGDDFNQRTAIGASVSWKIADSFFLSPEFTYYNYGKNPTVKGNPDLGTEWVGGVQFQFVF